MAGKRVTPTFDFKRWDESASSRRLEQPIDSSKPGVEADLSRLHHLRAVDDWLAEMEREHGPIPIESLNWAAGIVDRWRDRVETKDCAK